MTNSPKNVSKKNRAGIRFQPFNAIKGHREGLADIENSLEKKDKPILSEDQHEVINNNLKIALETKNEVIITYFEEGFIKEIQGFIIKMDLNKQKLTLSNQKVLFFENILCIDV